MISVPRTGVISSTVMKALSIEVSGKGDMRCLLATLVMSTALWPETKSESLHTLAHTNYADNAQSVTHLLSRCSPCCCIATGPTNIERDREWEEMRKRERWIGKGKRRDGVRAQKELHPSSRSVCIPLTGFFKIGMIIYTFRRNNQTKLAIKKYRKHFQPYCHYYHYHHHHSHDIVPHWTLQCSIILLPKNTQLQEMMW